MMPALDHCVNSSSEMTTFTKSLEVFDTYKHRDEKDSDEESFHLPLDDEETDGKQQDLIKNGISDETEDELLGRCDSKSPCDQIDSQLEDRLLKDEDEEKEEKEKEETKEKPEPGIEDAKDNGVEEAKDNVVEDCKDNGVEEAKDNDVEDAKDNGFADAKDNVVEDCKDNGVEEAKDNDVEAAKDNALAKDNSVALSKKEVSNENCLEKDKELLASNDFNAKNDVTREDDKKSDEKTISVENPEENVENKDSAISETETEIEKSNSENNASSDKMEVDNDQVDKEVEETNKVAEASQVENDEKSPNDVKELDKCENSNNDDSEDLFDISIIRDAEEDKADAVIAYNEAHQENEEDDKMEDLGADTKSNDDEDEEEMDIDKHDDHLKGDDVDIEETNLNSDIGKDSGSDGEVESSAKMACGEKKPSESASAATSNGIAGDAISVEHEELTCTDGGVEDSDANKHVSARHSLKRGLPDDADGSEAKKIRTDQVPTPDGQEVQKPKEKLPLTSLLSLSSFMKTKKINKRLTMFDLEEFCVQKMCEVMVHKGDLGDILHQLKVQEHLIETLRKEIQQLTKQGRDLEIVNKKLMNDLKQQTTTNKPLNPLKITRSVGLQVKFTSFDPNNTKKRPSSSTSANHPPKSQPSQPARTRVPNSALASPITIRQIATPQKQQPQKQQPQKQQSSPQPQLQPSKPVTPILSNALQHRRTDNTPNKTPNQNVRSKHSETSKTTTPNNEPKASTASVIDLTDEDDKKDKNKTVNNTKVISPKSITVPLRTTPLRVNTTQSIRLTTSQGKVAPITTMVNSSTPQVMYVVQSSPQNVLASSPGAKAVVFNLQTTNGVLTSTLNGSAVSVIPTKQANTIQLKTVSSVKPVTTNKILKPVNRHPAPLPAPPIIRLNSGEVGLKPIPPKPHLTIRKTDTGIILQWKMPYELDMYEVIASYQLYAYQETSALPSTEMWRKVGDVKALALPMACTLTQFADKNKYYFAVRPVDIHKRIGMFSDPEEISL